MPVGPTTLHRARRYFATWLPSRRFVAAVITIGGMQLMAMMDGTITIVALLFIVIVRAVRVAARADDLFGVLIASGVAIWFAFQSFVNIGMTIGITPITGLPLPFVSYGGSAIIADMIAIGMLQSVRRHHSVFD